MSILFKFRLLKTLTTGNILTPLILTQDKTNSTHSILHLLMRPNTSPRHLGKDCQLVNNHTFSDALVVVAYMLSTKILVGLPRGHIIVIHLMKQQFFSAETRNYSGNCEISKNK